MITYIDFLKEIALQHSLYTHRDDNVNSNKPSEKYKHIGLDNQYPIMKEESLNPNENKDYWIIHSYEVGGADGGCCFGGEPHDYQVHDENNVFKSFDTILEEYTDISFIAYKKVSENLIKKGSFSITEYYGNYVDYKYKAIKLTDLYETLSKENLFKDKYKQIDDKTKIAPIKIEKANKAKVKP